jgi:hypothetical protein
MPQKVSILGRLKSSLNLFKDLIKDIRVLWKEKDRPSLKKKKKKREKKKNLKINGKPKNSNYYRKRCKGIKMSKKLVGSNT